MKKILVIVGRSRKKGNTDLLADAFIKGAEEAGHVAEKVFLGDKKVNGCLGCNACRYGKPCIQKDDMQEIYSMFDEAVSYYHFFLSGLWKKRKVTLR